MKCANEMGSGAMVYIPNFIKIRSGIQKLIWVGGRHTDTQMNKQDRDRISLLFFFKIWKVG
jgi:hypothetical protein